MNAGHGRNDGGDRPISWIVAALAFVGAQFVVLPFLAFLYLLSDGALFRAPNAIVLALALLAASIALLRTRPGLFLAQLAFNGILSGAALLLFAVDLPDVGQLALLLSAVLLLAALLIEQTWLQGLLGVAATPALLAASLSVADADTLFFTPLAYLRPLNLALLAVGWAVWTSRLAAGLPARADAVVDGIGVGLPLILLVGEAASFAQLLTWRAASGSADDPLAGSAQLFRFDAGALLQYALAIAAFGWLLWRQRRALSARPYTIALLALGFAALALFAPLTFGGGALAVLFAGALAGGRRGMLALAGVTLLAKLAGFYYALAWPLVDKAALLATTGAALAALLWLARRLVAPPAAANAAQSRFAAPRLFPVLALLGALGLALGSVELDVRGKEQVLAAGDKLFVALAPRDPRSLLQGDYMALNFALPREIFATLPAGQREVLVVARRDARGIATVVRHAVAGRAETLAADELLLPLKWMNGGWTLVSDAFHFPEGLGAPFAGARFGEFRTLPDGQALLVGLADARLRPLTAAREGRADDPSAATTDAANTTEAAETMPAEDADNAATATIEPLKPNEQ